MSLPAGRAPRAAAAAIAFALLLAVAWVAPPLAMIIVWPLFLAAPGWAVTALLRPPIDLAGRIGLAIVISLVVSTHLVYWLSLLAGGYGRPAVFVAAAVLAAATLAGAWGGVRLPRLPSSLRALPALAVATLTATVVGGVLGWNLWRTTEAGVVAGGSNWSDLGVHLSIAQTVNAGAPFPPDVPYFSGEPLVYHWFADFGAAVLAESAGIFSVPAMVVQSALLAAALALLSWSLARRLLGGRSARRAATIAATIVVFGGGLGWIRLLGDMTVDPLAVNAPAQAGDLGALIANHSYDNQWLTEWPYFRIPSVMGTGLLAHRATTAGLPILVAAMLLFVAGLPSARRRAAGWRDRPALIVAAGALGALLAPFHFFFFPVVPLLALAWTLAAGRLVDAAAARNAAAFLGPYLLALPFVLPPLTQAAGSGALQIVSGWPSAPREDGLAGVAFFYVTNLGVPFALAGLALAVRHVPQRAFLVAWLVGLFLIPNLVQVSVIDFDMNKYFQAMWVAVAILAAWLMRHWPLPAVAAALVLSVPSPLLVAGWTATSSYQVLSHTELAAARWVEANTSPDAVFVTDGWLNSLTDPAGRRRLTSFEPYIANLGYDAHQRIDDVRMIYCGGDAAASAQLMRRYGAVYLVDGGRPADCGHPVDFGASAEFELAYDAGPLIWRLSGR